jgi:DNA polymerase-3 subunit delta
VSFDLENVFPGTLEQELARGRLSPAYLVLGPEEYLAQQAVETLRRHIVKPDLAAFNESEYDASGSPMADVLSAARTLPMMSPRRVVVVKELQSLPETERAPLLEYLAAPAERCVLILTASDLDRRTSFFRRLKEKTQVLEYAKLKGAALERWAANHMRSRGYTAAPGALKRLLETVGADLQTLVNELEKLVLYAGTSGVITEEAIDELAGASRQRGIFELTDTLGRRDSRAALRILASLLNSGESPLMIVTMMARHYRQILIVKEMLEGRRKPSEISEAAQVPGFIFEDFMRQARSIDRETARTMYLKLAETDRRFKSTNADNRMILESLICAL